ncbi:hypothetical protein DFJ74DRAFT_707692 [Hyaloraphidium curvatum]|nr:hypothetical protein DFJ74DRAFT_707692 [Hyaloraphidium curvatum]
MAKETRRKRKDASGNDPTGVADGKKRVANRDSPRRSLPGPAPVADAIHPFPAAAAAFANYRPVSGPAILPYYSSDDSYVPLQGVGARSGPGLWGAAPSQRPRSEGSLALPSSTPFPPTDSWSPSSSSSFRSFAPQGPWGPQLSPPDGAAGVPDSGRRSPQMAISSLLAFPGDAQGPGWHRWPADGTGNGDADLATAPAGAVVSEGSPRWDLFSADDTLLLRLMTEHGLQPLVAVLMAPRPQAQPGMFDDLPPLPPTDAIAAIIGAFFERVNPSLLYFVHPPTFFSRVDGGELLLSFALLGAGSCATPGSGHATGLAFFRRAQRLLQPLIAPLLQGRLPTAAQLCALCVMSWHASIAFSTSQLGIQLGALLIVLLRVYGILRPALPESADVERARAALEAAGIPDPLHPFPTLAEREAVRRVAWYAWCMDRVAGLITPFPGKFGPMPVVADADVAGLLLPCDDAAWVAAEGPEEIAAALGGEAREVLSAKRAAQAAAEGRDRRWWRFRLAVAMGKVIEYHWHCLSNSIDPLQQPLLASPVRNRALAALQQHETMLPAHLRPFTPVNPRPDPADVWHAACLHWAYISLHAPRKGAGLDPSALLSSADWLAGPDFPTAAEHSSRVAELVSKLDAVDSTREHLDLMVQIPAVQVAGTVAFVRMVVAQRAAARLRARGPGGEDVISLIEASAELARSDLGVLRRQQALSGRSSRMAAQMALFLGTMEEGADRFGRMLELAQAGVPEARAPVMWTELGLLVADADAGHVLVGWDEAVGSGDGEEWASPEADVRRSGSLAPGAAAGAAGSEASSAAVEWRWRLGGPELGRTLQRHASGGLA